MFHFFSLLEKIQDFFLYFRFVLFLLYGLLELLDPPDDEFLSF